MVGLVHVPTDAADAVGPGYVILGALAAQDPIAALGAQAVAVILIVPLASACLATAAGAGFI